MTNLTPFNNDGLELVIDTTTGESFASISAVARMTDKSKQSISRYVKGGIRSVTQMSLKTAEIQTPIGLRSVTLLNEAQIAQVIKHYKPELLKRADELAVRVFLHGLAGYKFTSDAVEPTGDIERLLEKQYQLTADKKCKNRNQGKYVETESLKRRDMLEPTLPVTRIIGLVFATERLNLEEDGNLATPHCINMGVKQMRRTQQTIEGTDSVPFDCLPKIEQADPENALINNPSSKQKLLTELTKDQIDTAKKALKKSPKKAKEQPKLPEGFVIDIPLDNIH
jgi:hypothetical protein